MSEKMPVLFVGHGSPMNAIEDNEFTKKWKEIALNIEKPKAILVISAHWVTEGTKVSSVGKNKTIYDMYGFPRELYEVVYDVPGSPELANETIQHSSRNIEIDNSWGIDHGAWSVLHVMYPKADIPVYQLSVDNHATAEEHLQMGKELSFLRDKGVLIMGSGNVVHNLFKTDFNMEKGFPWAEEFDAYILDQIKNKKYENVVKYHNAGESARQAFYTTEHFFPLLYVLGASNSEDKLEIFNNSCVYGALSMTGYLFG